MWFSVTLYYSIPWAAARAASLAAMRSARGDESTSASPSSPTSTGPEERTWSFLGQPRQQARKAAHLANRLERDELRHVGGAEPARPASTPSLPVSIRSRVPAPARLVSRYGLFNTSTSGASS